MPYRLWVRHRENKTRKKRRFPRVPALGLRLLKWECRPACIAEAGQILDVHRDVVTSESIPLLRRGRSSTLSRTWWPMSLEKMTFGHQFNNPVDNIIWPAPLQYLTFGRQFNHPVDNIIWPAPLQYLTVGLQFNQSILGVVWPASLKHLTFGVSFNQRIRGVGCPSSLTHLSFGMYFNRPKSTLSIAPHLLQSYDITACVLASLKYHLGVAYPVRALKSKCANVVRTHDEFPCS